MPANRSRLPVAVLGATGAVGQRFVALLAEHPWFELREVFASSRSAGKRYGSAMEWLIPARLPASAAKLEVRALGTEVASPLCFSALDARVALEPEEALARAGKWVISNASPWRMDARVPLVVPEVNPDHLALVEAQEEWAGGLLCNPNCSTIGLTLALAPLRERFGIERVSVVSMQAISGAGAPGIATLGMLANVVPFIPGEEEKLERETFKILGEVRGSGSARDLRIEPASFDLSAQCNRVPVVDGHTLCVNVRLAVDATREQMLDAWQSFSALPQELHLPTAPEPILRISTSEARPQPARDLGAGGGMAIHVGRLRERSAREWLFTTLSHNTVRGAAGGAILLAELALATGRAALRAD